MNQIVRSQNMIHLIFLLVFGVGCTQKISFNKTLNSCDPSATSARWGGNPGPIITTPTSDQAFNTTTTVTGTCINGYPVKINGTGVQSIVNTTCNSGTFNALVNFNSGDGTKAIDVSQATAKSGADATDRRCVTQDTTPPQVIINSGPSTLSVNTNVITLTGTCEAGLDVVISGPQLSNTVTTSCNGSFSAVISFSGPDGLKDITAVQIDKAGNNGNDNDQVVTDTTPPVVTISSPAPMTVTRNNISLTGACETGLRVSVQGDVNGGVTFTDCISGNYSISVPLATGDGAKTLSVSQTDIAGNIGSISRNYVLDQTPPLVRFTSPSANTVTNGVVTVTGTCESGLTVGFSGTGLASSSTTSCASGAFTANLNLSTGDGSKSITATQTDAIGNSGSDNRSFVRDTSAPIVAITSPAVNSYVGPSATISGSCESGITVNLTGAGLASSVNSNCVSGAFSSTVTISSGDGSKTVTASQTDGVGNTGTSSRTFLRDSTAPTITISSPAANAYVNSSSTISGSCESGLTVNLTGTISSSVSTTCTGGTYSTAVTWVSGDGNKTVMATQTDAAGNSANISRSFVRDGTPPAVSILSPAANSYVAASATISGSCETGTNVILNGSGVSTPVNIMCADSLFSATVTFTIGDGNKTVVANQTDAAGNTASDSRAFIRDSSAPIITINSPAANSYVASTVSLTGTCETGLTVSIAGTGLMSSSTTNCVSGAFNASITFTSSDGTKQVSVSQTDGGGSTGTDSRVFRRDTTAPVIAITSPAPGSVFQSTATISGTCEAGSSVILSGNITAAITAACTSGSFSSVVTFNSGDGNKTVTASQTDAAGNTGTDSRSFVRDSIAPIIAITSPAANSFVANTEVISGSCESGLDVTLAGSGVSGSVLVNCVSGAFSSAITFTAGDGSKTVTASQTDAASNTSTDSKIFRRDSTPPTLTITTPAANSYVLATTNVSGTCETGLIVTLNGSGIVSPVATNCVSGSFNGTVTWTSGDGSKSVTANQTDGAGNASSVSRTFVRDTVAPIVAITSPVAGIYVGPTTTLVGTCETGLVVTLNGAGITSTSTNCVAGAFSTSITFSSGDGNKIVNASQTDGAGNAFTDSRTFVRDTTGPTIAITSPAANSFVAPITTVSGTCETGLVVTLNGSGVMSPVTTNCVSGAFSSSVSFSLGDGSKQVTASQTDAAGNSGSSSRSFTRDGTAPIVAITSPAVNAAVGATATVSGTCETGLVVTLNGSGISSTTTNCLSSAFNAVVTFTSGDGAKDVVASQTDASANTGSDTRTFVRDSTPPVIAITTPAANSYVTASATVAGTCETGINVVLSGSGLSSPVTTTCASGGFSASVNFSSGDGNKNVVASQTDGVGNSSSDNRTFVRDQTAPSLAITSPGAGSYVAPTATVGGTCETGLVVTLAGTGVLSPTTTNCTAGAFSTSVTFSSGDGSKQVTASQTDAAGNIGSASRSFTRDSTGPAIAINSPAANSFVAANATISGACETGLSVTLNGSGVSSAVVTTCTAGVFSASVNFSSGDGNKNVMASQTDGAGNSASDNRTFVRDTVAPSIAITSPTANSFVAATDTISGTCETGLSVTLNGSGVLSAVVTACTGGTFSASVTFSGGDGNKVVTANQTDGAGNTGSNSRTFIRDTAMPVLAITAPAANSYVASSTLISGTCETGLLVTLDGSGVSSPVSTNCLSGAFSVSVSFSSGDGVKIVTAQQTDGAGNTGTNSRSFQRDSVAPAVAITSPSAGSDVTGSATIAGSCETGLTVTLSGSGLSSILTTNCIANAFSTNVVFSSGTGTKQVVASQTDAAGNTGTDTRSFNQINNIGSEVFTSTGPGGKVDILFVDDNSASMDPEQAALGTKFSAFTSALAGVDWQIGIITTDCTAGSPYNFCGQALDLAGRPSGEYILTSATPSYLSVFQNTIQRPETLGCIVRGDCPSGREEGLKSTIQAMNLRDTDNTGFFRAGSDLAVIMLTDEDEQSTAPPTATTATQVINNFKSIWGSSKKFSSYSIVILTGDTACLNAQKAQLGGNASYGTYPIELANLTGGSSVSICEPDYSVTLANIGADVTRLTGAIELAQTPIPSSVTITFTPSYSTTWTVTGNRITFDVPAPTGTQIQVDYLY